MDLNGLRSTAYVLHRLSVPSNGVNRVRRRLVEFLEFNSDYCKKSAPSNGVNRVGG